MKKSFVYLVIVLALAVMLCGCGMDNSDGVIGASPRPTDSIGTSVTAFPEMSPTAVPDAGNDRDTVTSTSNPQVGSTDDSETNSKTFDTNKR